MLRIGIDLGGSKIEGLALAGGVEVARLRMATPRDDYAGTIEAIASLVGQLEGIAGLTASVGVGIPGALSPATGLVKNANSVWLIGRPLREDLQRRLGREVRIANDANCLAVSEATDGAAAGAGIVFGVIVGTGVGGGIIVNGRLVTGANAIAGEWGHNALAPLAGDEQPGPRCYCGRHACIETFLSGPALSADHKRYTGLTLSPQAIADADRRGDAAAAATLARYEERMAKALAGVINLLDPDVIVMGGGLSNMERLYANVPRLWDRWIFACDGGRSPSASAGDVVRTRLARAAHGDSSGVRGAAWLWPAST